MKCPSIGRFFSLLCAASVLTATASYGQSSTLTIPFTLPPPVPVALQVNQKVTVGNLTYLATGTLTLTLTTTTASVSPSDLLTGPRDWPPFVNDFQDKLGVHVETAALGDELILAGNTFGTEGGWVFLGNEKLPVLSWADDQVRVKLDPALAAPVDHATVWTIERSGGAQSTAFGPPIRKAG